MKSALLLLAPALAAAVPAFEAEKRQLNFLGGLAANFLGAPKPAVVLETLTPTIDPAAKREVKLWGPFTLKPANASHAAVGFTSGIKLDPNSDAILNMVEPPCVDCTVLRAVAKLAYKDGKEADVGSGVYTHHIIMMQFGRDQLPNPVTTPNCPGGPAQGMMQMMGGMGKEAKAHSGMRKRQLEGLMMPGMSVFVGGGGSVGSGSDFAVPAAVSKVKSGAYVGPTDKMLFTSEVINYDNFPKDIYLSLDYEYLPKKEAELHNIGMGAISLSCSFLGFQPPADKAETYQGANWTMTQDGYFVGFTPHLHDGGANVKVYLNDKDVCTSTASYGSGDGSLEINGKGKWETITGYSPCNYMTAFKKGDVLRMSSEYDLTKHMLRPDSENHSEDKEGMAMATFIWAKA